MNAHANIPTHATHPRFQKPYDWDAWNRAWKCIAHGFRNPIPSEKVEAYVHVGSKLTGVVEAPGSDAFDYLPKDLFRRCDVRFLFLILALDQC